MSESEPVAPQPPATFTITVDPRPSDPSIWIARCLENGWVTSGKGKNEAIAGMGEIIWREHRAPVEQASVSPPKWEAVKDAKGQIVGFDPAVSKPVDAQGPESAPATQCPMCGSTVQSIGFMVNVRSEVIGPHWSKCDHSWHWEHREDKSARFPETQADAVKSFARAASVGEPTEAGLREKFEKWANGEGYENLDRGKYGAYAAEETHFAWQGYQAGAHERRTDKHARP